jgi:hypothetical protein
MGNGWSFAHSARSDGRSPTSSDLVERNVFMAWTFVSGLGMFLAQFGSRGYSFERFLQNCELLRDAANTNTSVA